MRRTLIICTVAGMLVSATACGGGSKDDDAKGGSAKPADTADAGSGKTSEAPTSAPVAGAHAVVLEVQGSGELPGILYSANSSGNASNVKLPWQKTDQVTAGHLLAVLASSTSEKLTCTITVDGKVVIKKTGKVAQCRYKLTK